METVPFGDSSDAPDPQRATVVIADDADDIRFSLRAVLTNTGHFDVVGEACDGREAVDACRRHRPGLLVLDLRMPGMGGYDAIPLVRDASPDTRIVVFSCHEPGIAAGRALQLGATAYVTKGGDMDELVRDLQDAIGPDGA